MGIMNTERGVATGLHLIFWGFMIALGGLALAENGWPYGWLVGLAGMALADAGVGALVRYSPFLSHRIAMVLVFILIIADMVVVLDERWNPQWPTPLDDLIRDFQWALYGTWPALSFAMWWFSIQARLSRCEVLWLITAFLLILLPPMMPMSWGHGFDSLFLAGFIGYAVTASFFFISLLRTRRAVLDGTLTRSKCDTKAGDGPAELPKDSP